MKYLKYIYAIILWWLPDIILHVHDFNLSETSNETLEINSDYDYESQTSYDTANSRFSSGSELGNLERNILSETLTNTTANYSDLVQDLSLTNSFDLGGALPLLDSTHNNIEEITLPEFAFRNIRTDVEIELLSIMKNNFIAERVERRQVWSEDRKLYCPSIILSREQIKNPLELDDFDKSFAEITVTSIPNPSRYWRGVAIMPMVNAVATLDFVAKKDALALMYKFRQDTKIVNKKFGHVTGIKKLRDETFLTLNFYKAQFRANLLDNVTEHTILALWSELDERATVEGFDIPKLKFLQDKIEESSFSEYNQLSPIALEWHATVRNIVANWSELFGKMGFKIKLPFEERKFVNDYVSRLIVIEGAERLPDTSFLGSDIMRELFD